MDPVKLQSTFTPDFDREKGKAGSHRRDTFPKPFWAVKGKTKRFKRCFRCFWRFKRSLWGSVFGCLCGTRTVFVGQCLSSPANLCRSRRILKICRLAGQHIRKISTDCELKKIVFTCFYNEIQRRLLELAPLQPLIEATQHSRQ